MTLNLAKQNALPGTDDLRDADLSGMALDDLAPAVRRVIDMAMRNGIPFSLRRLPAGTAEIESIAAACDAEPAALARCLLFRGKTTKKPMLVIASVKTQVSERALAHLVGEVQEKADATTTERVTGFPPEGLPPFALSIRLPILMDEALMVQGRIWCMAGSADHIMSVPNSMIARAIAARIAKLD